MCTWVCPLFVKYCVNWSKTNKKIELLLEAMSISNLKCPYFWTSCCSLALVTKLAVIHMRVFWRLNHSYEISFLFFFTFLRDQKRRLIDVKTWRNVVSRGLNEIPFYLCNKILSYFFWFTCDYSFFLFMV